MARPRSRPSAARASRRRGPHRRPPRRASDLRRPLRRGDGGGGLRGARQSGPRGRRRARASVRRRGRGDGARDPEGRGARPPPDPPGDLHRRQHDGADRRGGAGAARDLGLPGAAHRRSAAPQRLLRPQPRRARARPRGPALRAGSTRRRTRPAIGTRPRRPDRRRGRRRRSSGNGGGPDRGRRRAARTALAGLKGARIGLVGEHPVGLRHLPLRRRRRCGAWPGVEVERIALPTLFERARGRSGGADRATRARRSADG